jgi:iron complex transport system substrate-binding protein
MDTTVGTIIRIAALALIASTTAVEAGGDVPKRIISTAPSITEMIYALGAQDELVGVTSYCDFPPEAQQKPVIGDFAAPNIELMLSQEPDLVVILSGRTDLEDKLRPFSLPVLVLEHETLAKIYESIGILGERIGREEAAASLISSIENRLARIERELSGLPKKEVLFLVGRNSGSLTDIYVVGTRSYLGQLIELAGASNIFSDLPASYPKVSIEQILTNDPEIIIDMSYMEAPDDETLEEALKIWAQFPSIQAVASDDVHIVSSDVFLVPGPRIAEAVASLAAIFHGKDFK